MHKVAKARRAARTVFSAGMAGVLAFSLGIGGSLPALAFGEEGPSSRIPTDTLLAYDGASRHDSAAVARGDDPNELVTIIVQLEPEDTPDAGVGGSLLSAQQDRHALLKDEIALLAQAQLASGDTGAHGALGTQGAASASVEEVADYVNAIDGFAVKAPLGILDEVKGLDGVKRAFVERVFEVGSAEDAGGSATSGTHAVSGSSPEASANLAAVDATALTGSSEAFVPKNQSSLAMTGAQDVEQRGDGQVIAVLDSGFDTSHDAFSGVMDEGRVSWTREVARQKRSVCAQGGRHALYVSPKIPFAYDYGDGDANVVPTNGGLDHGAHVAGIAAANGGETRGSAPNAQLVLMKVANDFTGSIYESALVAALDDVAALQPDIVSMSLGSDGGFSAEDSDTMNDIFAKLESQGANVCISAGNSYTSAQGNQTGEDMAPASDPDVGVLSSPASSPLATAVASLENARDLAYFTAANGQKICYVDAERSEGVSYSLFESLNDGVYEYVDAGLGTQAECDALKAQYGSLRGKIAITEDRQVSDGSGIVMSGNRAANLDALRPAAIILCNSGKGSLDAAGVGGVNRPVICITNEDGRALASATNKTLTVAQGLVMAPTTEYSVNAFSSWGTTPEMTLKPEVAAPGGNIYSSVLNNKYGVKSGTSMAAPHFAGLCALVREYVASDEKFADMDASEKRAVVTQLLMSTARPLKNLSADNGYYSPRQQGAGSVDVSHAMATPVFLTVKGADDASRPKAELGESAQGTWNFTVELHNRGTVEQVYRPNTVALTERIAAGMFQQVSEDCAGNGVAVSYSGSAYDAESGLVSVAAGATASYTVSLACDDALVSRLGEAPNGSFIEGFAMLEATSADGVDLSVPYLGFLGDWSAAPAFDASAGSGEAARRYASRIVNTATEVQLGTNPLDSSSEADSDKAVLSTVDSPSAPNAVEPRISLLRGARKLDFSYADANGNVVRSYSYDYVAKSTKDDPYVDDLKPKPLFTGTDEEGNPVADGNYTLTVAATTSGPGSETQVCTFSFAKDTQPPEIASVGVWGEGDEASVRVVVSEGGHLAAIDFMNPSSGNYFMRVMPERAHVVENADGTRSYTFDVALSDVRQAWADAGNDLAEFPETPLVTAWDYGLNHQMSGGMAEDDDFVVDEATGELTGYRGSASIVAIPSGIASIGPNAFKGSTLKAVSIPASVRSIGEGAFSDTPNMTQVAFEDTDGNPNKLETIGPSAFSGSAVRDVVLPRSVTSLGEAAFAKSGLDSIQLPSALESVPALAFSESSVRVVYLPASLQNVGPSAFESCRELTWLGVRENGEEREGLPASTRAIGEDAFRGSGVRTLILNEGLSSIATDAFSESSLDELRIPDSVTDLQKKALADMKHLTKLVFGSGATQAQVVGALVGCESLQEIQVSDATRNLRSCEGVLFTADGVTLVAYPAGKGGAYSMPEGVKEVGPFAFQNAAVTSVSLGGVELVGESAFAGSALEALDLGSVKEIRDSAFANCSALANVDFRADSALVSIGKTAFSPGTPLERVELPDAVSEVGMRAFANNPSLVAVRLGVSFAGDFSSVFSGCENLGSLEVAAGNASYAADGCVLYFKAEDGLHLQRCLPGGELSHYAVKDGTVAISAQAFSGNDQIESITLPEGVTSIGTAAFSGCTRLSKVSFPDTLQVITGFSNTALQVAEFGMGVREIKSAAFNGHNPTQIIVRGGQNGSYASSLEGGDDVQPVKSAYFGPGMKSADFTASTIAPPVITVVPASMTSLKFNVPSSGFDYDPAAVRVYAVKDTAGWKAAKAALESIGADASFQLASYVPLGLSARCEANPARKTCTVSIEASGGVLAGASEGENDAAAGLQSEFAYRFVAIGADGAEELVGDWSGSPVYAGSYDGAERMRCDVRDATGLTASTTVTFENGRSEGGSSGESSAADEAAKKAAAQEEARKAEERAAKKAAEAARAKKAAERVAADIKAAKGQKLSGKKTIARKYGAKAFKLNVKSSYTRAKLTYKSSNVKVATVSKTGRVTVKAPGKAVITVTSKAKAADGKVYIATFKATVSVVLPKVVLTKATKSSKAGKLTVAWKRIAGAQGYKVKVVVGKKAKTYTAKGAKAAKKTVSAAKGKKAKVQVRAYSKASGKMVYSAWSAPKAVKVKTR